MKTRNHRKTTFLLYILFFLLESKHISAQPLSIDGIFEYKVENTPLQINNVLYNPINTSQFYTMSLYGEINAWNENKDTPIWTTSIFPLGENKYADQLKIDKQGKILLAVGADDTIALIKADSGEVLDTNYKGFNSNALPILPHYSAAAFSNDGNIFATADLNGQIYIWQLGRHQPVSVFKVGDKPVFELNLSHNTEFIFVANNWGMEIWNLTDGTKNFELEKPIDEGPVWINSLYITNLERFLVINTFQDVKVIDIASNRVVKTYPNVIPSEENSNNAALNVIIDDNFANMWRFNKSGLIEKLDTETGLTIQEYIDHIFLNSGLTKLQAFNAVALKPGTINEFIGITFVWEFNFTNLFDIELKISNTMKKYKIN